MIASIGRFILGFLVDKVWGLLVEGLQALWRSFQGWREKRRQQKQNDALKKAEDKLGTGKTVQEISDAACELEKAINSEADC